MPLNLNELNGHAEVCIVPDLYPLPLLHEANLTLLKINIGLVKWLSTFRVQTEVFMSEMCAGYYVLV